jgi:uncharacterized phage protein gp47/JayE
MSFVRKSYSEITESILSQVTKGLIKEKHDFAANRTKYRLDQPSVLDIYRIDGTAKGSPCTFSKDKDYRLSDNKVEWLSGGEQPDDNTPFFVSYRLNAPQDITDVNPGSVIRTIVESIALEMDFIYAQMNQIYNSAFIDSATGKSLDLVVSLLGISRKVAGFAAGEVTMGRNGEPGEIEVLREIQVFEGLDRYELKNILAKNIKKIDGVSAGAQAIFVEGKDYSFTDGVVIWISGGNLPDKGSVFFVDYSAYERILIPVDKRISTYSRRPENVKTFRTTQGAVLTKKSEGRWEVEVPVVALSPGKEGNVFAGAINVIPKPVMGIDFVVNKMDILNGTEIESDSELRERAKRALEMAGKATLISLKSVVESVPGVVGEVKIVDQPDGVPGVVQIIASGGDPKEIEKVINETRSAGIKVEFMSPVLLYLEVQLSVVAVEGMDHEKIRAEVDNVIRQYLGGLNIDEDVFISRIVTSALSVQGVKDVRNVTVNEAKENVIIKPNEKGELRTLVVFMEELKA